jgi:putative membrane protein
MRANGFLSIAFAAALAVACTGSSTGEKGAVGTTGAADVSSGDKDFVKDAVMANMAEVELGRLATERTSDPEIRKFAQMMISDHTMGGDKIKAIGTESHIEVPANLDEKHQDLRETLANKASTDFDREYVSAMVDGHKNFVDKLESRIDQKTLSDWKSRAENQATGAKVETSGKEILVAPEPSDDPVTMRINKWAAETYPKAYAHMEAAKALESNVKKRT